MVPASLSATCAPRRLRAGGRAQRSRGRDPPPLEREASDLRVEPGRAHPDLERLPGAEVAPAALERRQDVGDAALRLALQRQPRERAVPPGAADLGPPALRQLG